MPNEEINIIIEETVEEITVSVNETVEEITIVVSEGISNHSELNLDDGTNPHGTTKSDVGLSNVPNLDTTNAINDSHTHSNKNILDLITEAFTTALKSNYDSAYSWISTNGTNLLNHLINFSNPHNVTKSQVGLSKVDNTSDLNKPISTATQTVLDSKQNTLISGQNIRPVNGNSLLGTSDLIINYGFHKIVSPNFSPSSNTTYFFNGNNLGTLSTPSTSNASRRFYAMVSGRIKFVHIMYSVGLTAAAPNNLTVSIDNITQGTTLQLTNSLSLSSSIGGINLDVPNDLLINFLVTKNDQLTFKMSTPSFGSSPTNFNIWCELIIEKK